VLIAGGDIITLTFLPEWWQVLGAAEGSHSTIRGVQERLRTLSLIADRVAAATARLAGATSQHCSQPAIPIPMTHFSVRTPDG